MTQGTPAPRPQAPQASPIKFKAALRKAIRKNTKEPEIDFLNITAMLDMMTIILVFLLKNMSSSNAAPPQSDDLKLPPSIIDTQPKEEGVALFVTKSQILVGDNPDPVVLLPDRAQLASTGLDARYKRDGINGLYITPLGNALQVVREQDKAIRAAKGEDPNAKSEAIIIADQNTPYRLLLEVLYTLGQSEFGKFRLMVLSGSAAKQQQQLPARSPWNL
jgi:biopolymer transport protein ExbD